MPDTRQRILDTARDLFNAQGLHRVAVRDVARAAKLSPGNLASHFPTKVDLVAALVMELHELNARTVFAELPPALTLAQLLDSASASMRHMLAYRFVLLCDVDALTATPEVQQVATALRLKRRQRHDQLLAALIRGGQLQPRSARARSDYLFEQTELISSGWLRSATLRGWHDEEAIVLHYAQVGLALLEPYCTLRGRREIRRLLVQRSVA
jgi:AcrR family transcriptional regulator